MPRTIFLRRSISAACLFALILSGLMLAGCKDNSKKLDDGVIVNEKVDVLNSTALVATKVGQLKRGDEVGIFYRANVNGTDWVRIEKTGGGEKGGWIEARHVVAKKVLDQCLKLAKENADIPAQIGGRLKKETRLRLQPGRETESVTVLKSGTTFDILKRVKTEYKPPTAPQAKDPKDATKEKDPDPDENGQKFDFWYLARFPEESVYRCGWLYGGSIEIVEPDEIAGMIGSGRKTVAAIPFGGTLDKHGKLQKNFFILDKQIFNSEPVDFDRIYVVRWDKTADNYTSAFYEMNLKGLYPILYKTESETKTVFTLSLLSKDNQPMKAEYTAELLETGWQVVKQVAGQEQTVPNFPNRKRK
jgi:outer membrane murein-binding lipoprotein Lpp